MSVWLILGGRSGGVRRGRFPALSPSRPPPT